MNRLNNLRNAAMAASFACFALASTTANATVLNPGATISLFGTTYAANPALGGTVIKDDLLPLQITYNGVLVDLVIQDRVVRETASGALDFYVRVYATNTSVTLPQLNLLRTGFSKANQAFQVDVNYRTDGVGVAHPQSATRESGSGDYIEFNLLKPTIGIQSNGTDFMMIRTHEKTYSSNGVYELIIPGWGAYAYGGAAMPN